MLDLVSTTPIFLKMNFMEISDQEVQRYDLGVIMYGRTLFIFAWLSSYSFDGVPMGLLKQLVSTGLAMPLR